MKLSMGQLVGGALLIPALLLGGFILLTVRAEGETRTALAESDHQLEHLSTIDLRLGLAAKQLQIHIIQVQQWLTDISATRGAEGFDDGLDEAAGHARAFEELLDELVPVLESEQDDEALATIARLREDFAGYYAMGRKMAQAYIDGGPERGNSLMEQFDPFAERLQETLEPFVAARVASLAETCEELERRNEQVGADLAGTLTQAVVFGAAMVALFTALWWALRRWAVIPLRTFVGRLRHAGEEGDLTERFEAAGVAEVGLLTACFNEYQGRLQSIIREVGQATGRVAGAAQQLRGTAEELRTRAMETSSAAESAAVTGSDVSSSVGAMSSSVEQMGTSIQEIAENASRATQIAQSAVEKTRATNDTVTQLGQSSSEIGHVVSLITSVAEQTNLLALNATIESARAGEFGKGFAVVANEVKELAKQTGAATEEISHKIEAIQAETRSAVAALGEIREVVDTIDAMQATIASAVEEQNVMAQEINRGLQAAAGGSGDISSSISRVAGSAQETAARVDDAEAASGELAETAGTLQQLVAQFRY